MAELGCWYCEGEPEPGYIESQNNGPIGRCPICNDKSQREYEYDMAELQRQLQEMRRNE